MGELPLSLRLNEQTIVDLRREAALQSIEPDDLAQAAIRSYLDDLERERDIVRARVAEADKGIFVSEEVMMQWMDELDDDINAPPPAPDFFQTGHENCLPAVVG